jgi:hypothetical protein
MNSIPHNQFMQEFLKYDRQFIFRKRIKKREGIAPLLRVDSYSLEKLEGFLY